MGYAPCLQVVLASAPLASSQQVPGQEDEPIGPSFFWRTIEDDLGTIAQYYDAPVLSLRNAVYHLLREGRPGFQVWGGVVVVRCGRLVKASPAATLQ